MKYVLGSNFLLLTEKNIGSFLDESLLNKNFMFAAHSDKKKNDILNITAKSDFLRFAYILKHGGIWMDADTLCLSNFASDIQDLVNEDKIAWHSEQFFAAERNNDIIKSAVENMLSANRQTYANPGGIKDLIQSNKDKKVNFIPSTLLDPTGSNLYTAKNWNIVLEDRELTTFLSNQNCKIIKLYNSMLSLGDFSESCVDEFLDSGNILSRLFLKVNQSKSFWVEQSKLIEQEF